MTEPVEQPRHPGTRVTPRDPEHEPTGRIILWGWALFGLFVLLFGGTILVALIYLAAD